jgi:hypothetical protein
LDARSVTADQMRVVIEKVMKDELSARGVDGADRLCADLSLGLSAAAHNFGSGPGDTPDAVFSRLGGGASA